MNSVDKITVGIVSWYESDLIENLVSNLVHKTSSSTELEFIICDNTNGQDTALYEKLNRKCRIIPHDQGKIGAPSYGHAKGLNILLSNVATELCLFIDPDCMVLMNDWDVVCKVALLSDRTVAVGAPYQPTMIEKCHGFPVAYFMLFKVQLFKELGANWIPYHGVSRFVRTKDFIVHNIATRFASFMYRTFGPKFFLGKGGNLARKVFGCSSKDTGWNIIKTMTEHGYVGKNFEAALSTEQLAPSCPSKEEVMQLASQFELYLWEGLPIVTHLFSTRYKASYYLGFARAKKQPIAETKKLWYQLVWYIVDQMENLEMKELLEHQSNY